MDTKTILAELRSERERTDRAITAKVGRRPKTVASRRRRSRMSPAARRKLSRLLKQRWAQGKMKPGAKAA